MSNLKTQKSCVIPNAYTLYGRVKRVYGIGNSGYFMGLINLTFDKL